MNSNPYQTPKGEGLPLAPRQRFMGLLEYFSIAAFAVVAGAAFLHRLQLDNLEGYRNSPLIPVEVLGVAFLFLLPVAFFAQTVYFLILGKFWRAAVSLMFGVIAFILTIATMWIDPATTIYLT